MPDGARLRGFLIHAAEHHAGREISVNLWSKAGKLRVLEV